MVNHMPSRRATLEPPSVSLPEVGFVPGSFFADDGSIGVLHACAFRPSERVLIVRIVQSGPPLSESHCFAEPPKESRRPFSANPSWPKLEWFRSGPSR